MKLFGKQSQLFTKAVCLVLATAMLLSGFQASTVKAYAEEPVVLGNTQDDFTPVFRFAVTSDVHVRAKSAGVLNGYDQLADFYASAYQYSEAQPYSKLDGIFFIGDNTQTGAAEEQNYFFDYIDTHTKDGTFVRAVMGNHEFKATGQNYADPKGATAKFLEYSGYESEDVHFTLGGYRFIMMSPNLYDKTNAKYFTAEKLAWLEQELEIAVAATPDKPIFVMQHQPPRYTMNGSHGISGDADLTELLSKYPQVINFSGHTHNTITDPRIIWQDTFTALNTASLCYLSLPVINKDGTQTTVKATDGQGSYVTGSMDSAVRNAGMFYIVEVDANDTVRVLIYNMFTHTIWGEPFLLDTLDPEKFIYTSDRAKDAVKPEFPAGAALQLHSNHYKNVLITIPQAQCKDVIQNYRVEVYRGETLVSTLYRLSGANYGDAAPERVKTYIDGLEPSTTYTAKVYATSSWALDSEPLSLRFTTSPSTHGIDADVLDVTFTPDGKAVDTVTGLQLETIGNPTVAYDQTLGQYVADFDGKDDVYSYTDISYWYDKIDTSFTLESLVWLDATPTKSSMNPFSNLQSAGIGFLCGTDGNVKFYNFAGTSAYTIQTTKMTPGQWVHLIGTYDGSYIRFYVDGQKVAETAATGTVKVPVHLAQMMCIGADAAVGTYANYFDGKVATAKLYSKALSQEEITEIYNWTDGGESATICQEHGEITNWTKITGADWENGGAIAQGHYVLTENIHLKQTLTVAANTSVCINLAGFDITASGEAISEADAYRVFENSGNLVIMDSALSDGVISGGTAWIHGKTVDYAKGGNIYNAGGAVFTLYDGVISGGKVSTGANVEAGSMGGNLYGEAGSVINIKGGTVADGFATKGGSYTNTSYKVVLGGNIGSNGTVNISGGTVTGGKLSLSYTSDYAARRLYLHGGNIAIISGGELNISGGAVSDGLITGTRTNNATEASAYGRGGNIYASGANVTISGGSVTGGTIALTAIGTATGTTIPAAAKAFGANIYIANGTVDISGGVISGGKIDSIAKASATSTSTGNATVSAFGGNFYITDGATVNMTGGTVTGGSATHNSKAQATTSYGGNFCVIGTGVLNATGGVISEGVSTFRGGNLIVTEEGTATLSGDVVVTAGKATNGSNAAVQDATARLIIDGNAQLTQPQGKNCVYSNSNGKLDMYSGTVTGGMTLSATASSAKGLFRMFGGYVETLSKTDALPITQVLLYNGKLGSNPQTRATLGACACYTDNGDGTYTVWHEGPTDGTCASCACDYAAKQITMYSGSHTTDGSGAVCTVCGKTAQVALCFADGSRTLLSDTDNAVRLHLNNPGSYLQVNASDATVNIPSSATVFLDLNGKTAQVTGSGALCGMDTANDDYTLSSGAVTVADTVTVYGDVDGANGNRYIALESAGKLSFHRLEMALKTVALRTENCSIYYTCQFLCDSVLAKAVDSYGVVCSLKDMPGADVTTDSHNEYTRLTPGADFGKNTLAHSGAVVNIMTPGNSNNQTNGESNIYANAYICIDGQYLLADKTNGGKTVTDRNFTGIAMSLYDILFAIDQSWTQFDATVQNRVKNFYQTWAQDGMSPWAADFENIA